MMRVGPKHAQAVHPFRGEIHPTGGTCCGTEKNILRRNKLRQRIV